MPNYQESTVTGTQWRRACRVVIENPLNAMQSIKFVEEDAISLGVAVHTSICANLDAPFDSAATFPILDPTTDLPVGRDATHGEIYGLLYSLYMHLAKERDAALITAEALE